MARRLAFFIKFLATCGHISGKYKGRLVDPEAVEGSLCFTPAC